MDDLTQSCGMEVCGWIETPRNRMVAVEDRFSQSRSVASRSCRWDPGLLLIHGRVQYPKRAGHPGHEVESYGLTPAQADEFFKRPMTIHLHIQLATRFVDFALALYGLRLYGD
jgi:hypothetical protein